MFWTCTASSPGVASHVIIVVVSAGVAAPGARLAPQARPGVADGTPGPLGVTLSADATVDRAGLRHQGQSALTLPTS